MNRNEIWNIHSNQIGPEVVLLLILRNIYIYHPKMLNDGCCLFPGESQYSCFMVSCNF